MQKIKHFKVSVIQHTMSKATYDQNIFYTSDSELLLKFELIEKEYSYDSGEILLFNETDKSFVTRTLEKVDDGFVYQIESDIIKHYGEWSGQLQLVKNGEVYTSKPFQFTIENDLSSVSPQPTLTDINNWATLKQSANELIDEIQDIIIDVEKSELERNNKENIRQQAESERSSKENSRQQAESERTSKENSRQQSESKRENNEKQRQSAELERVDKENTRQQAENQRQSTFETNESERQTTFETNESVRTETFESNETTRQSQELEREKAEATRQENESVRQQALGDMNGLYERLYPVSKNLFNYNQLNFGGRLDRNTGGVIDSDKDAYTEYIPVKENTPYTISKQGEPYSAVAYDSDYNYIKGYLLGGTFGNTTLNTPINASFLRYSFLSNSEYEKIMLNEGNDILPFEEYQDQGSHDKTVAGVFKYLLDRYFNL